MQTDYGCFVPVLDSCRLSLAPGQPLSIFSFDPSVRIASTGLEFPTDGVTFDMWWKATLNRVMDGPVELRMSRPAKALLYLPDRFDGVNIEKL